MKKSLSVLSICFLMLFTTSISNAQQTKITHQDLVETASLMNSTMCPKMIDLETRIDNCTVPSYMTLQYNYTLVTTLVSSININEFSKTMEDRLIRLVKTTEELKDFRDNNITLNYYYKDRNGNFIAKFEITPSKYNK